MGLARDSKPIFVSIGGKRRYDISVRSVERYAGAELRDAAVMEVAFVGPNDRVQTAFELTNQFENEICQIGILDRTGNRVQYIHYGRIIGGRYAIGQAGSTFELTSRFEDQLLGEPLQTRVVRITPRNSLPIVVQQTIDRELVFNPRYEGKVYGNKLFGEGSLTLVPIFIDLNSVVLEFLTLPVTKQFHLWSIPDAVYYLCSDLNSSETHVRNPLWTDLIRILPQNVFLNNVSLPVGIYLGEALDRILNPFGYHWKITHDSATSRKIEVFSKDTPYRNVIRFTGHKPGTTFDDVDDKLPEIDLRVDNGDKVFNKVTVIGARKRSEITVMLKPDWDQLLEASPITSFIWDSPAMRANTALRYVYRKYKADLKNLSDYDITNNTIARRPMLPCLTLDKQGQPYGTYRGVYIDFSLDGGLNFKPIDSSGNVGGMKQAMSLEIIENEAAVIFTGKIFPAYARKYGYKFQVRATATFERDDCLIGTAQTPLGGKPLADTRELIVSAPDRFQHYERSNSIFVTKIVESSEIDMTAEINNFAAQILVSHSATSITGKISLHGVDNIDQDYLGGSIQELPRSVFLKTSPFSEKYPACTGVIYDIENQTTTLLVGVF
jgi:hypothetical protein